MSYVDGYNGALADIARIQGQMAALGAGPASFSPAGPGGADFASVLSSVAGSPAGTYGFPMEEGAVLPPGTYGAPVPGASAPVPASPPALTSFDAPLTAPSGSGTGAGTTFPSTTPSQALGEQAVTEARSFLGVPYLWGGTNPSQGLDCSGLVQDVYAKLGVQLPRTSQEQALVGQAVPSLAGAQPGDLVFYAGSDGTATSPGHVGIYIGNGEMIDAPYSGAVVRVDPVGDPVAIRRVTATTQPLTSMPATEPAAPVAATPGPVQPGLTQPALTQPGPEATQASTPAQLQPLFQLAAAKYQVPASLLSSVASAESGFETGAVSGAGAQGMMQLMPATASSMSVDPFDPTQAVPAAAQILASYHHQFGSWSLAVAAYNAGPAAVQRYGGVPPYPETQSYVNQVMAKAGMAVGQ